MENKIILRLFLTFLIAMSFIILIGSSAFAGWRRAWTRPAACPAKFPPVSKYPNWCHVESPGHPCPIRSISETKHPEWAPSRHNPPGAPAHEHHPDTPADRKFPESDFQNRNNAGDWAGLATVAKPGSSSGCFRKPPEMENRWGDWAIAPDRRRGR